MKGALIGGVLSPGNGLSYFAGKKKLALGLTLGGAAVGGILGYGIGRGNALNKYDHREREKDPKLRALEQKRLANILRDIQNKPMPNLRQDVSNFKEKSEKYGVYIEPIVYKYFKWINKFYVKNWKKWYKSITEMPDEYTVDFHPFQYIFLQPADEPAFLNSKKKSVMILCDPYGGNDHQELYWDSEKGIYHFPLGFDHRSTSLVGCLTNYVSQFKDDEFLNDTQRSIVREYLSEIKRL